MQQETINQTKSEKKTKSGKQETKKHVGSKKEESKQGKNKQTNTYEATKWLTGC